MTKTTTREMVFDAANSMFASGIKPSVEGVRKQIGHGSNSTILSALNGWWSEKMAMFATLSGHEAVPSEVAGMLSDLWFLAVKEANANLEAEKQSALNLVAAADEAATTLRVQVESLEILVSERGASLDIASETIKRMQSELAEKESLLAASSARAEVLMRDVESMGVMLTDARESSSRQITEIQHEARKQLELAQERFNAAQKAMLIETDRARQDVSTVKAESSKIAAALSDENTLLQARVAKHNALVQEYENMRERVEEIMAERARLTVLVDALSKNRNPIPSKLTRAGRLLRQHKHSTRQPGGRVS